MQLTIVLRARQLGFVALLLFVAASTGCSKYGKVKGKVIYVNGEPLGAGTIFFVKEGSKEAKDAKQAELKEDGTFESEAPIGSCKVYLNTDEILSAAGAGAPMTPGDMPGGAPMAASAKEAVNREKQNMPGDAAADAEKRDAMAKRWRKLPESYTNAEKTPLKYDIHKGSQEIEIKLEAPAGFDANQKPPTAKPGGMPGGMGR